MRLVIAGGGTGGHLFPGIALVEELLGRGEGAGAVGGPSEVLFVGTERGIEARVLPKEGYAVEFIVVGGLKGSGLAAALRGLARVPRALFQSLAILRRFRPDLVVGVGGYASGPVVLMAALTGRATAILEQNSVPGFTNRVLGRFVRAVFINFEESRRFFPASKVRLAGNPIRRRFLASAAVQQQHDASQQNITAMQQSPSLRSPSILICGGSQGAHAVNELVASALVLLAAEGRATGWRVVHQTGAADQAPVAERYRDGGVEAEVVAFIEDMARVYRGADLVVARAGATTLAEIAVVGLPSLLIPLPTAADDHQTHNARALEAAGAAKILAQPTLTPRALADAIAALVADGPGRARMAAAARAFGRPEAAREIVDSLTRMTR